MTRACSCGRSTADLSAPTLSPAADRPVYLAFCGAAIGLSVLALIDPRAAAFGAGMGLAWLVLAFLGALLIGRLMDGDVHDGGTGRHDAGLADQSVSDAAPSVVNRNGYPRQNGTGVQS